MTKSPTEIAATAQHILEVVPATVLVVAAAKTRTTAEIEAAIDAGITCIGHNYVQDARRTIPPLRDRASWHMIGHLQRNKINKALHLFDMIETLDSLRLARALDSHCAAEGIVMPVLVEINSGREPGKTGVFPEDARPFVEALGDLAHLQVQGVMTMGPRFGEPEAARPYFRATREVFESLATLDLPNVTMRHLSMGMSNTYQIAIEEGATIVRIGSALFGSRSDHTVSTAQHLKQ